MHVTSRTPADPGGRTTWPPEVAEVFERAFTCEYASLTRAGVPVTWPVGPFAGDGTLDVTTGLTYPAKAERARRDPRVALLYSDPTGSGITDAPVVLVQGLAAVRDADLQANTDRYLRAAAAKFPEAFSRTPWFVMRRQAWYLTRIWIEVTPLRMLWWPGGRLDAEPLRWQAAPGVTAPPSDPAPDGPPSPPWLTTLEDWRRRADHAAGLGAPVLTATDADGWPLPLRSLGARRVDDGFVVRTPPHGAGASGQVCLTFHAHREDMSGQDGVVLMGHATPVADGVHVRVERALPDFSMSGNAVQQVRKMMMNGRALKPRLEREAARRGQPVPVPRRPR